MLTCIILVHYVNNNTCLAATWRSQADIGGPLCDQTQAGLILSLLGAFC